MANVEIDLQLNDEQKVMRDMVKKFGTEVIRPIGIELDRLSDPADVIAKDSRLWELFRQYHELGLHKTGFAQALGGMAEEMDPLMSFVIIEELGYADVGLAISLGVAGMP